MFHTEQFPLSAHSQLPFSHPQIHSSTLRPCQGACSRLRNKTQRRHKIQGGKAPFSVKISGSLSNSLFLNSFFLYRRRRRRHPLRRGFSRQHLDPLCKREAPPRVRGREGKTGELSGLSRRSISNGFGSLSEQFLLCQYLPIIFTRLLRHHI